MTFPKTRLRRLRQNNTFRALIRETHLNIDKLILPLFIHHGVGVRNPIPSMPNHYQLSVDQLEQEINEIVSLGIRNIILFGIPSHKDAYGSDAYAANGIIQTAIPIIKKLAPNLLVMSDLCFCEYTDHGHCGVVIEHHYPDEVNIDNDATLELLGKQAVSHAQAGADVIAPSGNMDGMVHAIRDALDAALFKHVPILSYSIKYASAMYGPFRDATQGSPQFGNRATYQMDVANGNEALRECDLDIAEGADMLMVKPAHTYLDVIYRVKQKFPHIPLCAYQTSGEYAMLKASFEKKWLQEEQTILEVLTAIHRAGADFVITYFAKDIARYLAA